MNDVHVASDDPRRDDVRELLDVHLAFTAAQSPPEDVHALDLDALCDPSVTFVAARDADGRLLGIGALKELDRGHGELKSMHTAAAVRGRGVARAVLDHLLELARQRGYRQVSLETGTMAAFAPACAMYAAHGFVKCEPFADYRPSPYSAFFTLALT